MRLNRPDELNATNHELHSGVAALWPQIDDDPEVRAVVLTGNGRAFSAGGDFHYIDQMIRDEDLRRLSLQHARQIVTGMVACRVPVIAAEIGENDCSDRYITPLMNWLDQRSDSYLAWSWNTASSCAGNEKLISNESGTPTAYGTSVRAHLRALAAKYR